MKTFKAPTKMQRENLETILKRISTMIYNWDAFSEKTYTMLVDSKINEPGFDLFIGDFRFNANSGICENAWPNYTIDDEEYYYYIKDMILSWGKIYGNRNSLGFFIGGIQEYKYSKQLYRNPLRLHACLYFRNYIIDILNTHD